MVIVTAKWCAHEMKSLEISTQNSFYFLHSSTGSLVIEKMEKSISTDFVGSITQLWKLISNWFLAQILLEMRALNLQICQISKKCILKIFCAFFAFLDFAKLRQNGWIFCWFFCTQYPTIWVLRIFFHTYTNPLSQLQVPQICNQNVGTISLPYAIGWSVTLTAHERKPLTDVQTNSHCNQKILTVTPATTYRTAYNLLEHRAQLTCAFFTFALCWL